MLNRIFRRAKRSTPEAGDEIVLPVVWLLGKTGAGKSSLVGALTEQSDVEIGDGFQPCTRSARSYDFPPDQPLVRFLDTRGLGEAGYDPAEDLAACRDRSHVLLVVCRLDDPVQGVVADALSDIIRAEAGMRTILVLTGKDLVTDPDARDRAERTIAARMGRAAGRALPAVSLSLAPSEATDVEGLDALRGHLLEALPAAGLLLEKSRAGDAEQIEFEKHKRCVLSYAGVALTSDFAPVVGMVAVPATQLKMLHELGLRYGVKWDRKVGAAFLSTMGVSHFFRAGPDPRASLLPTCKAMAAGAATLALGLLALATPGTRREKDDDSTNAGRQHVQRCARDEAKKKTAGHRGDGGPGQREGHDGDIGRYESPGHRQVVAVTQRQQRRPILAQRVETDVIAQRERTSHRHNCYERQRQVPQKPRTGRRRRGVLICHLPRMACGIARAQPYHAALITTCPCGRFCAPSADGDKAHRTPHRNSCLQPRLEV